MAFIEQVAQLKDQLAQIVRDLEKKVPYATILVQDTGGLNLLVDSRQQMINPVAPHHGTVVTVFDGERFHELAIDSWEPNVIRQKALALVNSLVIVEKGIEIDPGQPLIADYSTKCDVPHNQVSLQDKLDFCSDEMSRIAQLEQRIVLARAMYNEARESKLFVNRTRVVTQEIYRTTASIMALASNGKTTQYSFERKSAQTGYEIAKFTDEDRRIAVERAIELLSAEKIEPGFYDVVACPQTAGIIAHEAFGHGVELDMFLKKRALAASYVDKPVGSKLVNLVDDPTVPGAYGSYYIDDEGYQATPTTILENGVFKQGISDLYSAMQLGSTRTANGRRQDYTRKVYPRMSNTFFVPGDDSFGDMIASIDSGIYLEQPSSGMEDPKGWGIQVLVQIGREIKNGKLTGRVFNPIGITGYVPDLLQSISMVGNDLKLSSGGCGKGHKEIVTVSSGGPHIKMKARLG